ncbi:MAG: glycosyltransferase [Gracilibacteraceae bacterium]|jgi:1,2-diacylglycerol-3-alpha-glucose alpha-1,2-glucosyltransferase|nr:glycosyltransferase [Gracilibacteraceae bacterium]
MRVLLFFEHQKLIGKSGVGRALEHQKKALAHSGVEFTTDAAGDFDIAHINTLFPGSLRVSGRARALRKTVVFHAHSTEEDFRNSFIGSNWASPLFRLWLKRCYGRADLIITPTPYAKGILESYGLKTPIRAISNGIDLTFFDRQRGGRDAFRKKYGFKDGDKVILSVGLWIERKGILDFVELAERLPEYKFIWFGHADLRTVPAKVRKAVRAERPNLIFPGYVGREELRDAYRGCDLLLFPSHEETEGIVVLEALAMNTPVLLRDIPVYRDWLTDGVHVYKGGSTEEFCHKIIGMMSGDWRNLTKDGHAVAEARAIELVGKRLLAAYTEARAIAGDRGNAILLPQRGKSP